MKSGKKSKVALKGWDKRRRKMVEKEEQKKRSSDAQVVPPIGASNEDAPSVQRSHLFNDNLSNRLNQIEREGVRSGPEVLAQTSGETQTLPTDILPFLQRIEAYSRALFKIDAKLKREEAKRFRMEPHMRILLDDIFPSQHTFEEKLKMLEAHQVREQQRVDFAEPYFDAQDGVHDLATRKYKKHQALKFCKDGLVDILLEKAGKLPALDDDESSVPSSSGHSNEGPGGTTEQAGLTVSPRQHPTQSREVSQEAFRDAKGRVAARRLAEAYSKWRNADDDFKKWRDDHFDASEQKRKEDTGEGQAPHLLQNPDYRHGWQKLDKARAKAEAEYRQALSDADALNAILQSRSQTSRFPEDDPSEKAASIARSVDFQRGRVDHDVVDEWVTSQQRVEGPRRTPSPGSEPEEQVSNMAPVECGDDCKEDLRPERKRKIRGWRHVAQETWINMKANGIVPASSGEDADRTQHDPNGDEVLNESASISNEHGADAGDHQPEPTPSERSSTPSYSRWLKRKLDEAFSDGEEERQYPINQFDKKESYR